MATSTSEDVFSTPQKSSLFNNAQRFPSLSSSQTTDTRARSPSIASTPDLTDASSISGSDSTNSAASIALGPKRAQTPSPRKLSTAPKPQTPQKIRAPLTIDAKPRKKASPAKTTRIQLGTPVKSLSRSATPSRPRTISSPGPKPSSRIFPTTPTQWDKDPEESLVDWRTVEDADGSFEMEEEKDARIVDDVLLGSGGAGSKDKVLVNVRIKPPSQGEFSAWISERPGAVKLEAAYAKVGTANTEHYYDNVLTGSANKPIYNAAAKSHVRAAMEGYNAVIFAYGQTASGKTFTLSGSESEPGIIPRAMRDVFTYIRNTPSREFLLRASYLEIYKEQIHDLLSSSSSTGSGGSLVLQDNGVVPGLREEVVMSVKGLKEVLERGEANRRTASTDWNARSSRSHSVFRLIIESREVASLEDFNVPPSPLPGGVPCTPGGSRLQARGGRSVRTSTLSLIDLAGSERATSDKARTSEGRYINQSLLTLGTVIGTLAENAGKKKQDFVPFRNSKLTKLLQPSLSGNARISVICTLNPSPASISESLSTLQFASRVKKVHLNATKKEIVDTDALIERYRKEILDLKARLAEREKGKVEPTAKRRLSAREQEDENRAMDDLNSRIKQLTNLILTSQTVEEARGDESRPVSPCKLDFDLSPFQLQEQLLSAKRTIDSQANQILSLEAALSARPLLPSDAPETEKDRLIDDLRKTVRELEIVTSGYEDNLGAPLRAVKEDVEREWKSRVEELEEAVKDKVSYIEELERALEREKQMRIKSEREKVALVGFVREIDLHMSHKSSLTLSSPSPSPLAERRSNVQVQKSPNAALDIPPKLSSLLEEDEVEFLIADVSADFGSGPCTSLLPLEDKENTPL